MGPVPADPGEPTIARGGRARCDDHHVTRDADIEMDADTGQVIVSLSVSTAVRVDELERYLRDPPVSPFIYDLGRVKFDEPAWDARADKLNTTIHELVDRLESVPLAVLHAPESFVRLFMTLPSGAETLHAGTVKRLAEVNATVWIDA